MSVGLLLRTGLVLFLRGFFVVVTVAARQLGLVIHSSELVGLQRKQLRLQRIDYFLIVRRVLLKLLLELLPFGSESLNFDVALATQPGQLHLG